MAKQFSIKIFIALALLSWCACNRTSESQEVAPLSPEELFKNPEFQSIYRLQDFQRKDDLITYFASEDPTYRYAAAMAFGSFRDSTVIGNLAQLLQDPVSMVRQAAAYALGQIGSSKAESKLLAAFDRYDSLGTSTPVNAAILEAVGKCGTRSSLHYLSQVTTYKSSDTLLLEGQAFGIYRFSLRGLIDSLGTKRMVQLATEVQYPSKVRMIAANYLARANVRLDTFARVLAPVAPKESNINIRMALASALGKTTKIYVLDTLRHWFPKETDYRVRVNIIKALGNHDYNLGRATVFNALGDPNPHVAHQASQYFVDHGQAKDATFYWQLAKDSTYSWQTQANLFAAAQRYLPPLYADLRDKLNFQHRRKFEKAVNPYAKAAFLRGLSWFGWNYRYILREGDKSKSPVVHSAAWEALEKISSRPDFNRHFGLGWRKVAKDLSLYFRYTLLKGDAGSMVSGAIALRNPERDYKAFFTQFGFLDTALTRLTIPRDLETYLEVQKTINFFKGVKENSNLYHYDPTKHPIDWDVLASLGESPTAVIETPKGEIRIRLFPGVAPGTVANFVKLARAGFYNNKTFHRVVANFIVQGGCPRGDGYGSLDYVLRTEVPPRNYDDEGYIGMASAGPDTEGVQFFITHSPTLHLDGKYTLFGKVSQGMSIVHTLLIGDIIQKITIQKQ